MKIKFGKDVTQDLDKAIRHEWLETSGLGGWAGSTVIGANTRRYHGLLVAATKPPVGRMVLLSKLDETIEIDEERHELGSNQFSDIVHPRGYQYLQSFEKSFFPSFEYEVGGIGIRKTIVALHGENTTLILYEFYGVYSTFRLELQPFVAARDYHGLMKANDAVRREGNFQDGIFQVQPYEGVPELYMAIPGADFEASPDWHFGFEYPVEKYRGLDFQEDLFTHGRFKLAADSPGRIGVIISTENPAGRDAFELLRKEKRRRQRLLEKIPVKDYFSKTLTLAADQFVVQRGDDLRTMIAGYHWFADWGRDTMIALPGIALVTGRFQDAKRILSAFARSVNKGMLPNRFPDVGEEAEYNTVDATLWFFVAVYKYLQYTEDHNWVCRELLPVLQEIIDWHDRGTRYNIHVNDNGLLYAGEPGVQLTWMDAKIGDWVVTPRQGYAVEINALWYNALMIYAELLERFGDSAKSRQFRIRANKVRSTFLELFWSDELGYLYDYVDGEYRDPGLRPNQIFALHLPFPLLEGERAKQVLSIIEEKLYTPFGLRSLSPDDPNYRANYGGDQFSRDSAYHQGTVWSWLLGPYVTALVRFFGIAAGREKAVQVVNNILPQLREACIGNVSEIFDAEPPHTPRGAVGQAWSVAELLRAYMEDVLGVRGRDQRVGGHMIEQLREYRQRVAAAS
jgi:predicted glycogen debranching enzyme